MTAHHPFPPAPALRRRAPRRPAPGMRPAVLAAIALAAVLALGNALWIAIVSRPDPPAAVVGARFWADLPAPPGPALTRYAERRRVGAALAFLPPFLAAPQAVYPLGVVDLSDRGGSALAFAPPMTPPAAPNIPEGEVPLPAPRPFVPDDRVLDDAQIASLKERLKLTAAQARLWEPVEGELRGLVWQRAGGRDGPASLDAGALQRLKAAADRLLEALREDQKREVRMLMGIVGL